MRNRTKHARRILLAMAPILALPAVSLAQCPSKGDVEKAFEPLSKGEKLEIIKLGPAPFKGLCEVQFKGSRGIGVVYIDERGDLIFSGEIIDVKNRRSLTRELMAELNAPVPLTAAEMQKVAALTAVTLGKGEKTVFFVTDPMWPHCKRAGAALKILAEAGVIQVKVLMFPLPSHQGAKEQCVAVICDKKGFNDLEGGYKSDNQCAEGVKQVAETIAFLQGKGINSTPSYILPDGRIHAGVLDEEQLRQKLGIGDAGGKSPAQKPPETKK